MFLDELEKSYAHANEEPLDILHGLWERQSARKVRDECLEIDFAADHVIWIATCNEIRTIRPSLIDRLRIFHIPRPTASQMQAIVTAIYTDLATDWYGWFLPDLNPEIARLLGVRPPRQIKAILADAMMLAASEGRQSVSSADVEQSDLTAGALAKQKFGFI